MCADRDVIVVGAGPAGAIAALVLARAGVRVRVLDRARFPRFKLCGDSVNPGALADPVAAGPRRRSRRRASRGRDDRHERDGRACEGRYGDGQQGRMISRHRLDHALLAAARRRARASTKACWCGRRSSTTVAVRGVDGQRPAGRCRLRAPIVIAADGASSRVARALGLARHARAAAALGRWRVLRGRGRRAGGAGRFGEMHLRTGRYIGIAPLPGGVTNACVVTADRARAARSCAPARRHAAHRSPARRSLCAARMITAPRLPRPARRRGTPAAARRTAPRR